MIFNFFLKQIKKGFKKVIIKFRTMQILNEFLINPFKEQQIKTQKKIKNNYVKSLRVT